MYHVGKFMILLLLPPFLFRCCLIPVCIEYGKHNCEKLEGHKDKYTRKMEFQWNLYIFRRNKKTARRNSPRKY